MEKPHIKLTIKKIAAALSKNRKILAVYLFGSHAAGKATPLSDIDICVIAPGINEKEKMEILSNAYRNVDIVMFDELPFAARWRVLNEGEALYAKDRKFVESLKWRAFKDYTDFKPILRRHMQKLLPGVQYV
ncbi:MAG: nucleotidyltransferase domain-containing protein [Nanoarchaeota archaeon]|nr:nucleotidyltransferase domain-containing protein [Nanoarchaeota archaeon]